MDKYDITLIISCNSRICKKNYSTQEVNTITQQNQQPRRERRGTVLNVSHCVFYKVVAVGFNTLCYDAERSSKLYIRV